MIYFLLIVLMTILGSIASLVMKKASGTEKFKKILLNSNFYFGCSLYIIAALINIYILRYFEYTVILPLNSLTYIWTIILAFLFLKERMTMKKIFGAIGIVIGAILITK